MAQRELSVEDGNRLLSQSTHSLNYEETNEPFITRVVMNEPKNEKFVQELQNLEAKRQRLLKRIKESHQKTNESNSQLIPNYIKAVVNEMPVSQSTLNQNSINIPIKSNVSTQCTPNISSTSTLDLIQTALKHLTELHCRERQMMVRTIRTVDQEYNLKRIPLTIGAAQENATKCFPPILSLNPWTSEQNDMNIRSGIKENSTKFMLGCFNCGQVGHRVKLCPQPRDALRINKCYEKLRQNRIIHDSQNYFKSIGTTASFAQQTMFENYPPMPATCHIRPMSDPRIKEYLDHSKPKRLRSAHIWQKTPEFSDE